ncbi:methionyl-tRNA formyltransferase [Desulfobacula sp.]|uniref:methionyl-tRNA formyltransferase n=1 Tax=Desulfobacula sp. TaxID=2593537 RepID=UPI002714EB83|nr:formyltransferase family protein [Desulfobacula sp.]
MSFNILFITQDDPFYIRNFFAEFFSIYPNLDEIKAVVIQRTMGKKSKRELVKQMYALYGLVDFFRMGMRYTQVKILSEIAKSYQKPDWFDLRQLCGVNNIEILHQNALHQPAFLDKLRRKDLDLIISVAAPTIFRKELIDLPRLGCINIHHAPLPRYRGMMPNFWQLYHGEKTVGITVHKINPKIDEGEIILQKEVPVNPGESLDALIMRTKQLGAHYMLEAIEMMRGGRIQYQENRSEEGSYFSFPTRKDVRRFRAMGYRLL